MDRTILHALDRLGDYGLEELLFLRVSFSNERIDQIFQLEVSYDLVLCQIGTALRTQVLPVDDFDDAVFAEGVAALGEVGRAVHVAADGALAHVF